VYHKATLAVAGNIIIVKAETKLKKFRNQFQVLFSFFFYAYLRNLAADTRMPYPRPCFQPLAFLGEGNAER